jgi:hypothetical protein
MHDDEMNEVFVINAATDCIAKLAGATLLCRSSRSYTVMQKQQALHCNAEAAGATL